MSQKKESDLTMPLKPRDLAEIVRTGDNQALEQFLDQPFTATAEALIGVFSTSKGALLGSGIRILHAALTGDRLKGLSREILELRKKGKINQWFEGRFEAQTWVELLMVIDGETPDEERLDALKAMFFAVNKINATDAEKMLGYQLFQIAKRLTSGELLVLKAVYELVKQGRWDSGTLGYRQWAEFITAKLGHNVISLVEHYDKALVDNYLLTPRLHADSSGVTQTSGRLTDLGIRFCQNIENYHIEKSTSND